MIDPNRSRVREEVCIVPKILSHRRPGFVLAPSVSQVAARFLRVGTKLTSAFRNSRITRAIHRGLVRLDQRFPMLSNWMGGRLDVQIPAIIVSVATHVALLTACAMIGLAASVSTKPRDLTTSLSAADLADYTKLDTVELTTKDTPLTPSAGSFGPDVAPKSRMSPMTTFAPVTATPTAASSALATLSRPDLSRAADIMLPKQARYLDQTVSIRGNGSEHVGGVEGAVDRVALEILQRLEKGRTLVVWAFDASGSLQAERERLAKHIDAVYAHIDQLDNKQLSKNAGLLTTIVSFGKDRKALTPKPTNDPAVIQSAIHEVELDRSGIESTFQTVIDIVNRWGRFKLNGERYETMIIVVTDEVGDDEAKLEEAIAVAEKAKVPVYVLGSSALFSRVDGFMDYTDPKTKQTYYHLPVRQGPESITLEQIHLPFWYDGPQYEIMDAGFGPYALSRLAGATGGIYFVTRMGADRYTFDPLRMREYRPDWMSKQKYEQVISQNPLRQAVIMAARVTQQNLPGQPSLTFPAAGTPEFKEAMRRNQEIVARITYTIDEAIKPIKSAAKLRDREKSRRWQAHYDLIRGRLTAMLVRCYEYNWACAKMKKDAPKFQNEKSNAWRLVPDQEVHFNDGAAAAAKQAKALLERVVEEHPGTPWALLAKRELKDPMGFKWVETYVPPPPPRKDSPPPKKEAKPKPMMKAEEIHL